MIADSVIIGYSSIVSIKSLTTLKTLHYLTTHTQNTHTDKDLTDSNFEFMHRIVLEKG